MTAVFYPAEDCAKIAPFIPRELLKDWEWFWHKGWLVHKVINKLTGEIVYLNCDTKLNLCVIDPLPALDAQIVRERLSMNLVRVSIFDDGRISIYNNNLYLAAKFKAAPRENILNAMLYLIDNKLIKEAV